MKLLQHFQEPAQRIQVLAALARGAGKAGDRVLFAQAWDESAALIGQLDAAVTLPHALLDLGLGAAHFGLFHEAEGVFRQALELGERRGQGSVVILADKYIAAVQKAHNPDIAGKPVRVAEGQQASEQLAGRMASLLEVTAEFAGD